MMDYQEPHRFVDVEQLQHHENRGGDNNNDEEAATTIWISPEFVQEIHNGQTRILAVPTAPPTPIIGATAPVIENDGATSRRDEEQEQEASTTPKTQPKPNNWRKWICCFILGLIITIVVVLILWLYIAPNYWNNDDGNLETTGPTDTPTMDGTTMSPTTTHIIDPNPPDFFGYLTIAWAGAIDNGEGEETRGLGLFRYIILDEDDYIPGGGFDVSATYGTEGSLLPGESAGEKWSDGGERTYSPSLHIYEWSDPNETKILFVYESKDDCEYNNWCFPEVDDDPIFVGHVNRQELISSSGYQKMIASPYEANGDAIQNAESKSGYDGWINRADVQEAINEAWDYGDLAGGRLPKILILFRYSDD